MIIHFPLEIITPRKKYPPAGRCIYCGSAASKLADEHIVPFALAGDLVVLPKASCFICAAVTGKTEQYCLRNMLGNFRIKIGAPTRRPKERSKRVRIEKGRYNKDRQSIEDIQSVTVSATDLPLLYPSITFPPAGAFVGRTQDSEIFYKVSLHRTEGVESFLGPGGAIVGEIYPMEFARMVAKITYAYAVAELGVGGFRPFVLDLILGRTQSFTRGLRWVGCEPDIPPATGDLLSLSWNKAMFEDGRKWLIGKVQLFPFFSTPVYHVVLGEWDRA